MMKTLYKLEFTGQPMQGSHASVGLSPARGMNARRMFDSLTSKKGTELQPKLEINEIHTLLHLVRTGRWVAILVDSIIHGEEGLCAVPLREAALPMPVVWLYPKDMYIRKAMQKFVELI